MSLGTLALLSFNVKVWFEILSYLVLDGSISLIILRNVSKSFREITGEIIEILCNGDAHVMQTILCIPNTFVSRVLYSVESEEMFAWVIGFTLKKFIKVAAINNDTSFYERVMKIDRQRILREIKEILKISSQHGSLNILKWIKQEFPEEFDFEIVINNAIPFSRFNVSDWLYFDGGGGQPYHVYARNRLMNFFTKPKIRQIWRKLDVSEKEQFEQTWTYFVEAVRGFNKELIRWIIICGFVKSPQEIEGLSKNFASSEQEENTVFSWIKEEELTDPIYYDCSISSHWDGGCGGHDLEFFHR